MKNQPLVCTALSPPRRPAKPVDTATRADARAKRNTTLPRETIVNVHELVLYAPYTYARLLHQASLDTNHDDILHVGMPSRLGYTIHRRRNACSSIV